MENICSICAAEPGSHSFTYLCKTTNKDCFEYVFYTCIGEAKKYKDSKGIIEHYTNCLNLMNPDKWIWVINADGISAKHYAEMKTIKKLAKLVKEFGRVENIFIVNAPGLLDIVLKVVKPILDKETFGKIKVIKHADLTNKVDLSEDDAKTLKNMVIPKYDV